MKEPTWTNSGIMGRLNKNQVCACSQKCNSLVDFFQTNMKLFAELPKCAGEAAPET